MRLIKQYFKKNTEKAVYGLTRVEVVKLTSPDTGCLDASVSGLCSIEYIKLNDPMYNSQALDVCGLSMCKPTDNVSSAIALTSSRLACSK